MSRRVSNCEREARELHETPVWVTETLRPHLKGVRRIWEPANGNNAIAKVLQSWGLAGVFVSDISRGTDFLLQEWQPVDAIVTNPPHGLAQKFIEHALEHAPPHGFTPRCVPGRGR